MRTPDAPQPLPRSTRLALTLGFALLATMLTWAPAAAAQQATPVELDSVAVSCPGLGRVDFALVNLGVADQTVTVGLDQVEKQFTVPANSSVNGLVSGRQDGIRPITLDGVDVEDVQIRCGSYEWGDDFAQPSSASFYPDFLEPSVYASMNTTFEIGEPTDCVQADAPGTRWTTLRMPADAVSLAVPANVTVAIYTAAEGFAADDFDDLAQLDCVAPGSETTIELPPGTKVWMQSSTTAVARPQFTLSAASFAEFLFDWDVTCLGSGGLLSMQVTNTLGVDAIAEVELELRNSQYLSRTIAVAAGQTGEIRVSARSDGEHAVRINNDWNHRPVWVQCNEPTGANDTIATALPLTFNAAGVTTWTSPEGTFGHTRAEIDNRCFDIGVGSSWYKVQPSSEVIFVNGGDDQEAALFASSTENPTTLSDLELLTCGEPEDRPGTTVVPGSTYWIAITDSHQQPWRVVEADRSINSTLSTARELVGADEVPGGAAPIHPEEPDGCGLNQQYLRQGTGTYWWKWTAPAGPVDFSLLTSEPREFFGYGEVGIFTADVAGDPSYADLEQVDCVWSGNDSFVPLAGQTYWLRAVIEQSRTITIAMEPLATELAIEVSCLAGRGRIDVVTSNQSDIALTAEADFSPQRLSTRTTRHLYRTTTLAADAVSKLTVTGRPDGNYSVNARVGTEQIRESVQVRCENPNGYSLRTSCLGGNGRVDVSAFFSGFGAPHELTLTGPTSSIERPQYLRSGDRMTITGRPNGDYVAMLVTTNDNAVVLSETFTISC